MIIETKTQFADRQGVNKSTVSRWAKAGRLALAPNGRVIVEQSIDLINATQGARGDVADRHTQNRGQTITGATNATANATNATSAADSENLGADIPDMQLNAIEIGEDRAYYKAVALNCGNQQLKLDESIRTGLRLNADDFKRAIQLQGHQLRSAVERLIDNLAPQISILTDENERSTKMQTEIDAIIEQIS